MGDLPERDDRTAAENDIPLIHHDGLTWCYRANILFKFNDEATALDMSARLAGKTAIVRLHLDLDFTGGRRARNERDISSIDPRDPRFARWSHHQLIARDVFSQHEKRFTNCNAKTFSLAKRIARKPLMGPEAIPLAIDYRAGFKGPSDPALDEPHVVTIGDEANILAFGLIGNR